MPSAIEADVKPTAWEGRPAATFAADLAPDRLGTIPGLIDLALHEGWTLAEFRRVLEAMPRRGDGPRHGDGTIAPAGWPVGKDDDFLPAAQQPAIGSDHVSAALVNADWLYRYVTTGLVTRWPLCEPEAPGSGAPDTPS